MSQKHNPDNDSILLDTARHPDWLVPDPVTAPTEPINKTKLLPYPTDEKAAFSIQIQISS